MSIMVVIAMGVVTFLFWKMAADTRKLANQMKAERLERERLAEQKEKAET